MNHIHIKGGVVPDMEWWFKFSVLCAKYKDAPAPHSPSSTYFRAICRHVTELSGLVKTRKRGTK